ncbi:MAG TPA: cysteine hydrolase family protein [Thermomicrobiales bacterium]|nr:cysteine hydrolase family protein [Thermomicrobiales bacterium]
MSTLKDRPNTALLVIDVQNGVMDTSIKRDEVVENINTLVEKARAAEVPVVWIQHESEDLPLNSERWQLAPGLKASDDEPHIGKKYGDSFEDTNLESVLKDLGVSHLVVSGAQTDACVRSTLHGAVARGYDALLVSDAHTTEDLTAWGAPPPEQVIAHTNLYWSFQKQPGRKAGTVETKDVIFEGVS